MHDLIERQAAIDAHYEYCNKHPDASFPVWSLKILENLPSAQPETHEERTETHACDCISRQWLMECVNEGWIKFDTEKDENRFIHLVRDIAPSAQPEPLSDAYTKAVWTWLLDYQIKAAELKGKYTPYEVLSWVANDWRKEHERSD